MSVRKITQLAFVAAFAMMAIACDNDKMRAKLPKVPPPEQKTAGCPELQGFWGTMDDTGNTTPIALFDKSEDGLFRYTDLQNFKESIVVGQDALTLTLREGDAQGKRNLGMLFCKDGVITTRVVETDSDPATEDQITLKVWTLDDSSASGQVEITKPDGSKTTEILVKVIIEDRDRE